jgi:Flp pilus assembly protein protease CpaA
VDKAFFPDVAFAWMFCVGLVLLIGIAAWTDTRRAKIPNRLCLVILALGLVMSAVRAGWLAADNKPLRLLETGAVWRGVIDGLLWASAGFLVAFAVMFVIWIMGSCGGGDVKLLASVSAWVGPDGFLFIWLGSVLVLFVWMGARILSGGMTPRGIKKTLAKLDAGRKAHDAGRDPVAKPGKRVTFSLPLLIATACILLVVYRYELQLVPPKSKPQPDQPQGALRDVRPSPPTNA